MKQKYHISKTGLFTSLGSVAPTACIRAVSVPCSGGHIFPKDLSVYFCFLDVSGAPGRLQQSDMNTPTQIRLILSVLAYPLDTMKIKSHHPYCYLLVHFLLFWS